MVANVEVTKPELIALISVLAGVIGVLFGLFKQTTKREQERLQNCESNHAKATEEIKDLYGKVNYLRGEMDGVKTLSESVLRKLNQRRENDAA